MNTKTLALFVAALLIASLGMTFFAPSVAAPTPMPTPSPTPEILYRLFEFKPEQVGRLLISADGKSVSFSRQRDGFAADSLTYRQYETRIGKTLENLANLKGTISSFGGEDIAAWGLITPTVTAVIYPAETQGPPLWLKVGKIVTDTTPPNTRYYASTHPARAEIFAIPAAIVDELKSYLILPNSPPTTVMPTMTRTATAATTSPTTAATATATRSATATTIIQQPLPAQPVQRTATQTAPVPGILAILLIVGGGFFVMLIAAAIYMSLRGRQVPSPQPRMPTPSMLVPVGQPNQPGNLLTTSTVLQNRYRIQNCLGTGGMGAVYLARHLGLGGKPVAVKENRGGDARQFQAEAVILANLNHSNLPRVLDHFLELSGAQYLVMDCVEGENLDSMVKRCGPLAETVVLAWMRQVLDAVKYLHANRVIHRDIKAQNIIITPQGKAILVDFGISKTMTSGQPTFTGARAGTPGYAPPEQYTGGTAEYSDVYSLGATLYYLLTGQVPPESPNRATGVALVPPRQINSAISSKTETVILAAMDLQIYRRYGSIAMMEQALN